MTANNEQHLKKRPSAALSLLPIVVLVATFAYLPYCFFNILSPIMSVVVAATGYKIVHKKNATAEPDD